MSTNIFRSGSGSIKIETGDYGSQKTDRRSIRKERKLEWDQEEYFFLLQKSDKGLIPTLKSKGEILIRKISVRLPLRRDWEGLLKETRQENWCFLGNHKQDQFLKVASTGEKAEIRISLSAGHRLEIIWYCDKKLLNGEEFQPGSVILSLEDPKLFSTNLTLGQKRRNDRPFLKWREFIPREGEPRLSDQFDKELARLDELSLSMNGFLFTPETVPQAGDKQGSPRQKELERMITELRKKELRCAFRFYPLRMDRKHSYCQEFPTWFLQDGKGRPLQISRQGKHWQILDITHREVQNYLVKRMAQLRSWGFILFLFQGMDDLLLRGRWQDNRFSLQERIGLFFQLLRKGAGEGALFACDRFFTSQPNAGVEFYFPTYDSLQDKNSFFRMLHLYPLTHAGAGLSMGPLYLDGGAGALKEAFRERDYHLQLIAGGLAVLGGPCRHWTEDTAEKWARLTDYHHGKGEAPLRLEPMGFRQHFIMLQSSKGILAIFNMNRRKGYFHMQRDASQKKKPLTFEDSTSLNSSELTLRVPGKRSRLMRF